MTEHEQLISAYGYEPVESKNPVMRSYSNEDKRINYYFTSGTITIQQYDRTKKIVSLKSPSLEELEDHLCQN